MFGFGKKKLAENKMEEVKVTTIPNDFYGGKNPVFKFKKTATEAASSGIESNIKKRWSLNPAVWLANRNHLLIVGAALFVLFIIGAGVYYWFISRKSPAVSYSPITLPTQTNEPTPPATAPYVSSTTEISFPAPTSTAEGEAAPILGEGPLTFPSLFLADSVDLDKDGLTDLEEELFTADPAISDTDADGHNDSKEVYNLYNPIGKEPIKIIDSGLVKEFTNPVFGYKIYYPTNWAVGNVDQNYKDVLFSTLTGENIEVRALDKPVEQSFNDWFNQNAPTQKFSDLVEFNSVFKEKGYRRSDWLVYYFMDINHVYVIIYNNSDLSSINYRTVIKMLARSFRFFNNKETVPAQATPVPQVIFDSATSAPGGEGAGQVTTSVK